MTSTQRPWGKYEVLGNGRRYKVKLICVRPGQSVSLQRHMHRAEHWVVVSGVAKVCVAGKERFLRENESIFVPQTAIHRLENPGREALMVIEVQTGGFLSEEDIERLEDKYGRLK